MVSTDMPVGEVTVATVPEKATYTHDGEPANLAAAAPYRERIAELRRALAVQPAAGEKR